MSRVMVDRKMRGRPMNMSSIHAALFGPSCSAYTGVGGRRDARTLVTKLPPHGVTANVFAPGASHTDLTRPIYAPPAREVLFKRIPLQAVPEPDDVAHAALFLASPGAWYITGTRSCRREAVSFDTASWEYRARS